MKSRKLEKIQVYYGVVGVGVGCRCTGTPTPDTNTFKIGVAVPGLFILIFFNSKILFFKKKF